MPRHDDDFYFDLFFLYLVFIYGFLFYILSTDEFFIFRYVFIVVVGSCDVVSLVAVVALLSADLARTVFRFYLLFSCGSGGGI